MSKYSTDTRRRTERRRVDVCEFLIIPTSKTHIALTFAALALLFTLAGFLYRINADADQQASIVRAYFKALEAERRLDRAEHHAQDIEFMYRYAILITPPGGE